jgi:hypothetical protein
MNSSQWLPETEAVGYRVAADSECVEKEKKNDRPGPYDYFLIGLVFMKNLHSLQINTQSCVHCFLAQQRLRKNCNQMDPSSHNDLGEQKWIFCMSHQKISAVVENNCDDFRSIERRDFELLRIAKKEVVDHPNNGRNKRALNTV